MLSPPSQKAIFIAWNDGNFENVAWPQLKIFLTISLAALVASAAFLKMLDALVLGDRYGRSLGHSTARARYGAVLWIVALAGSVTAFCGPICISRRRRPTPGARDLPHRRSQDVDAR
jgi:iron complex transport system permease protein